MNQLSRILLSVTVSVACMCAHAQEAATPARPRPAMAGPPPIVSPEILSDGRVTFRLRAPDAKKVEISRGDLSEGLASPRPAGPPDGAPNATPAPLLVLEKATDGVWSGTTSVPVRAGAYRYTFSVDGVAVIDQSNKQTSPSQGRVSSLLVVPGDFSEERAVPHGALSEIAYQARSYGPNVFRRLMVYTPPGYERSTQSYPVLYLLHGGGDSAESWATVGRANFILDNLIAEKKAVPFIVVMMSGWTPKGPQRETIDAANDPLNAEFVNDILPMIEARYRVKTAVADRALSGLSMGGYQTLTLGMKNIDKLAYVLPMSTGWFNDDERGKFVAANRAAIEKADKQLKLFRWGYGSVDIAKDNGLKSIEVLRGAGMKEIETVEYPGGHTWPVWRELLRDYAQRLFR